MNMTSTATKTARTPKSLATDAISAPSLAAIYSRKCQEIDSAKQKLADLVARQIKVEADPQRRDGAVAAVERDKAIAEATIARLEREGGVIKLSIIEQRPAAPLTPAQAMWADAFDAAANFDPYAKVKRGTATQIEAARNAVDELVAEYFRTRPSGNANQEWQRRYNEARTRLAALEGPPFPQHMPWASRESLTAARVKEGLA